MEDDDGYGLSSMSGHDAEVISNKRIKSLHKTGFEPARTSVQWILSPTP